MSEELKEASAQALESVEEAVRDVEQGSSIWKDRMALLTIVLALFSAVGALLAGIKANQSLQDRMEQIIDHTSANRERLQIDILETRLAMLKQLKVPIPTLLEERIANDHKRLDQRKAEAAKKAEGSDDSLSEHEIFAIAITLMSISITLIGMALLANRKWISYPAVFFALVGIGTFVYGSLRIAGH